MPHSILPAPAAAGYSPITHDWGLHPTGACSRKLQARLLQQSAVRRNDQLLSQLQSVLRASASARLVLQRRKFDPIFNDIREKLHWLPIRQRITYKLCLIVFRCLLGEAPAYLWEIMTPLSGIQTAHGNLHIPELEQGHSVLDPSRRLWAVFMEFTSGRLEKHWLNWYFTAIPPLKDVCSNGLLQAFARWQPGILFDIAAWIPFNW